MSDLSSLSDSQLTALYHGDFSKLSDDDLKALHAATTPDPVSINDVARSAATGVPIVGGLLDKADAATNAALAPALNSLFDPKDQLPEATFGERYAHSLRDQEGADAKFASQHPYVDTGAKIAGGVASMAPVVAAAPGLFGASGSFASRVGAGAASNAALGAADSTARGQGPIGGAITGGVLGAAAPIAETALSPFFSAVMGHIAPQRTAEGQIARAVSESGQTPQQLSQAVTDAAAENQPQFTLADALGNPGQRMLSTVARAPGQGRTDVVTALNNRQSGQGDRIISSLEQGFGSRMTPTQLEDAMTAARGAQADADFGAVRNDANPVDVLPAINHIDETLGSGADQQLANPGSAATNDSVEGPLQGFRNRLARVNPDDFASVQRIRGDMADAAQNAMQSGFGNRARLIRGAIGHLDTAMENASPGFRQANRNFSQASRDIDAIGQGRQAAARGRTADVLSEFSSLQPRGQQAFRTGLVDPLIAKVDASAPGVNKARPLLNDRFGDIANATAPGAPLLQRQLGRENTMFETRNQALGGSRTADNLNDHEALGINPTTVMHVASGHWAGAIGSMLHAGVRGVTGNTPAVRAAVGRILLQNGANLNAAQLNQMVSRTVAQIQFLQQVTRGTAAAAAVTANANQKPPIFARNP